MHLAHRTPHPTPYTLHSTPYTLHPNTLVPTRTHLVATQEEPSCGPHREERAKHAARHARAFERSAAGLPRVEVWGSGLKAQVLGFQGFLGFRVGPSTTLKPCNPALYESI